MSDKRTFKPAETPDEKGLVAERLLDAAEGRVSHSDWDHPDKRDFDLVFSKAMVAKATILAIVGGAAVTLIITN